MTITTCAGWLAHASEMDDAANRAASTVEALRLLNCADADRARARALCQFDALDEERVAGLAASFSEIGRRDLQLVAEAVYAGDERMEYLLSLLSEDWRISESVRSCAGRWVTP